MDDQEFCEQPQHHQYVQIKELFPANPIYDKPTVKQQKPVLRIDLSKAQLQLHSQLRPHFKKQTQPDDEVPDQPQQQLHAFQKHYQTTKCIYKRYENSEVNTYRDVRYFASCFVNRRLFRQNKEEIRSLEQLNCEVLGLEAGGRGGQKGCGGGRREVGFDSAFQSGNLFAVFKKSSTQYDLILQNDLNSKGNTQWFYFTVVNLPQNVQITFNIVNLLKSDSLFNYGMQPVVLSELKNKKTGEGWTRQGRCISYYRNTIKRQRSRRYYYTLTFKLTSKIAYDRLHIAHCYPYTYSMLTDYLSCLSHRKGLTLTKLQIGKSVGNIPIESLTITESSNVNTKKIIVVMARQHPGETQGSYVCQGFMEFLLGKSKEAEFLRKNFVFKIIPMVNPDGVVVGNYRTNLMGHDLNRKWDQFDRNKTFPEVNCIKHYISELNKQKKVKVILDLHGHSKKLSSFFYGNPHPQQPQHVRGFPYTCSKLSDKISFQDCTFSIEQQKKKAARVYLSLLHQITHVYTYQSSFYGYTKEGKKVPFGVEEFKGLGGVLGLGLAAFLEYEVLLENNRGAVGETKYGRFLRELREDPRLLGMGEGRESGSETNPEEFEVDIIQLEKGNQTAELANRTTATNRQSSIFPSVQQQQLQSYPLTTQTSHKKPSQAIPPRITNSSNANTNTSRKSTRNLKQSTTTTKPPRMKVMQISRVNAVIPDRYEMGLQPNKSRDLQERFAGLRKSVRDFKMMTSFAQTELLSQQQWSQLKLVDSKHQQPHIQHRSPIPRTRPLSSKFKDYQMKYVSLSSGKCKKNLMLKVDMMARPLQPIYNPLLKYNNTSSQTMLTYVRSKLERLKLGEGGGFAHQIGIISERIVVGGREATKDIVNSSRTDQISSVRLSMKQQQQPAAAETFGDVLKRYMICPYDVRKTKLVGGGGTQEGIFNRKSLPAKFQELMERPLTIKKKEILVQKKVKAKQ